MNVNVSVVLTTAAITIVLALATFVLSRYARTARSTVFRSAAVAVLFVLIVVSPFVFDAVLASIHRTEQMSRVFVDPSFGIKLAPAIVAVMIAIFGLRRQKHSAERGA